MRERAHREIALYKGIILSVYIIDTKGRMSIAICVKRARMESSIRCNSFLLIFFQAFVLDSEYWYEIWEIAEGDFTFVVFYEVKKKNIRELKSNFLEFCTVRWILF